MNKNNLKKIIIYPINYSTGGSNKSFENLENNLSVTPNQFFSPNPVASQFNSPNPVTQQLREPSFTPITIYSNQPINVQNNITNDLISKIKACDVSEVFCLVDKNSKSKTKHIFYQSNEEIKGFIKDPENLYFNIDEEIGQGSFGKIIKLQNLDDNKKDTYVLKEFTSKVYYLEEKLFSMFIRNLNNELEDKIRIVDSYWYENNGVNKILINGFDGDLEYLVDDFQIYNPFKIFYQLVENVYKLYKNDMYYVDLKLPNTLYKEDGLKLDIFMGDIGSIVSIYKSESFNLFKSKDLLNSKIKLNYYQDNFFKIKFKIDIHFVNFGYIDIGDNNLQAIKDLENKSLEILEITPQIKLKTNSNETYLIEPFYFISEFATSTYPHFKLHSGVEKINPSLGKILNRTLLINNIFHSLIIALLNLLVGEDFDSNEFLYFNANRDNINVRPNDKFNDIKLKIPQLNQTTDELNDKLMVMIFGSQDLALEPMFNLDFNENFNDENEIEKVFQNCMNTLKELM